MVREYERVTRSGAAEKERDEIAQKAQAQKVTPCTWLQLGTKSPTAHAWLQFVTLPTSRYFDVAALSCLFWLSKSSVVLSGVLARVMLA